MKKHIISLFLLLLPLLSTFAQTVEDVTLLTSASAPTEEEAIVQALRSAIEQTYGSFVSANTAILNDELVKDEVVSVSHGNVKSYEKLSSVALPNGQVEVTLNSTISVSKLISFAQSKGAEAEFAGQTFAMNMKLMNLKEKNALAAYEHMCILAGELLDGAFNYKIELEEPTIGSVQYQLPKHYYHVEWSKEPKYDGYFFNVNIKVLATPRTSQIYELITNTINSIKLSEAEVESFKKVGKTVFEYYNGAYLPISKTGKQKLDSLDKALVSKAIISFFNYSIVEIANDESYISWIKRLPGNGGYKLANYRGSQYNSLFGWPAEKYSDIIDPTFVRPISKPDWLWLVNNLGAGIDLVKWSGSRIGTDEQFLTLYHGYQYGKSYLSKTGDCHIKGDLLFFSNKNIILKTNWQCWELPIIRKEVSVQDAERPVLDKKTSKKSKKQKDSVPMRIIEEYSSEDQIIVEYILPFFIPEKQMETFAGLRVQTPSRTLNN